MRGGGGEKVPQEEVGLLRGEVVLHGWEGGTGGGWRKAAKQSSEFGLGGSKEIGSHIRQPKGPVRKPRPFVGAKVTGGFGGGSRRVRTMWRERWGRGLASFEKAIGRGAAMREGRNDLSYKKMWGEGGRQNDRVRIGRNEEKAAGEKRAIARMGELGMSSDACRVRKKKFCPHIVGANVFQLINSQGNPRPGTKKGVVRRGLF